MTTAKAQGQRVHGVTGGGQVARMYRAIRDCWWTELSATETGGPLAKAILYTYATYADADGGSVYPGDSLVADKLGICVKTVARVRRYLQKVGAVTLVREAHWAPIGDSGKMRRLRAEYRVNVEMLEAIIAEAEVYSAAMDAVQKAAAEIGPWKNWTESQRNAMCDLQRKADQEHDVRLEGLRARLAPSTTSRVVSPPSRPAASASA